MWQHTHMHHIRWETMQFWQPMVLKLTHGLLYDMQQAQPLLVLVSWLLFHFHSLNETQQKIHFWHSSLQKYSNSGEVLQPLLIFLTLLVVQQGYGRMLHHICHFEQHFQLVQPLHMIQSEKMESLHISISTELNSFIGSTYSLVTSENMPIWDKHNEPLLLDEECIQPTEKTRMMHKYQQYDTFNHLVYCIMNAGSPHNIF